MKRPSRPVGLRGLQHAFDEVRFGTRRTLNLRESLPTAAAAATRAEAWLRQQQIDRAEEVLVITGRGNQSEGGISVVRERVIALLHTLKRRGVVGGHVEHTPGSFVVTLAPISALWDSPSRNRDRAVVAPPAAPASLESLDADTKTMLRNLAERSLEGLGIKDTATFLHGEMLKHFSALATTIGPGADREQRLRQAIQAALDQYE